LLLICVKSNLLAHCIVLFQVQHSVRQRSVATSSSWPLCCRCTGCRLGD